MKSVYKNCIIDIKKESINNNKIWFGYIVDIDTGFDIEFIEEDCSLRWFEVLEGAKQTVDQYRDNPEDYMLMKKPSAEDAFYTADNASKEK